jgi:hypothetical protein
VSDELHYLLVPDDPDRAMEIEHPECCPQHGHVEPVKTFSGSYACEIEREVREHGLESSFDRYDHPPMFLEAPIKVRPGRYPVEIGLRLAAEPGTAA